MDSPALLTTNLEEKPIVLVWVTTILRKKKDFEFKLKYINEQTDLLTKDVRELSEHNYLT